MALGRGALLALLVPPLAQSLHLVSDEAEARAADECPLWCHASKQQWHVKCTYMRCSACPSCGPAGDSTELQGLLAAVPEAEPQALLGGRAAEAGAVADDTLSGRAADVGAIAVVDTLGVRAAEAGAIAEVTTQRSNESVTGVAGEGVEDVVQCPIWCHVSKQYWNVKCSYMRCSNCPMCGPPTSKDSKEAAPEAEPQALLGGRAAEASAVAEVATQRSNQSDTGAAGEGVEDDPQCPLWCSASRQSWSAKCAMGHCSTCPSCGPLASKEAAPEAEPQGLLGGRAAGAGAMQRSADITQCPLWCHASKQQWHVKCTYMRCSTCPSCGPAGDSRELQGLLAALPEADSQGVP